MTYNVFGGTLNLAQFNSIHSIIIDSSLYRAVINRLSSSFVDTFYYVTSSACEQHVKHGSFTRGFHGV